MKRILCLSALLLLHVFSWAQSQDSTSTGSGAERVQALRVAFFTQHIPLTADEAQKFWPVYNLYLDKREVVRTAQQDDYRIIKEKSSTLSADSLTKLADDIIRLRDEDVKLQSELNDKLKVILPPAKLAMLYVAEDDFKKELLKMLKDAAPKGVKGPN